jgi:hypothetical protein
MKKFAVIMLLMLSLIFLASCTNSYETYRKHGQLVDILVFDVDGNEIQGEFIEASCINNEIGCDDLQLNELSVIPFEAEKDFRFYYVVDVIDMEDYIVQFKIEKRDDLFVKYIIISNHQTVGQLTYHSNDFFESTHDENFQYISIRLENITQEINYISFIKLVMYKGNPNDSDEFIGTSWQKDHVFIDGVYFNFNE